MATLHFTETTTSSPEQFIAALTDFGPGRSKIFGNSADEYLKVHSQRPGHADVTEGSGGVWERLDYDWSRPNRSLCEPPIPTPGEGIRGTRTSSHPDPMARPSWTPPWCARART